MTNFLVPFADVDPNDLRPVEARPQRRNWLDYYSGPELSAALGRAAQLMEFLSPATDFVDALGASAETARGVVGGNPWETGAGLAGMGAALGSVFLPGSVGAADEVIDAGRKGIRAYHGSPHDFDKFSLDKIGTGEGAQAYGHGLYFAENERVARQYRDALQFPRIENPSSPIEQVADDLNYHRGDVKGLRRIYNQMIENGDKSAQEMAREKLAALPEALKRFKGRMYEVRINAEPDDFLDWDAPLSAQPEKVRAALGGFNLTTEIKDGMSLMPGARLRIETDPDLPEYPRYFMEMDSGEKFRLQPRDLQNMVAQSAQEVHGKNVISTIANQVGGQTRATERLREAGIPGIRYYDAGSRGAGDGSRNYVVFDDSLIEIIRKYGLAGLALLGGLQALPQDEGEQY